MSQLPAGVEGVAAGVLIWSFVCLTSNVVLLWLLWVCNERRSCQYSDPFYLFPWVLILMTHADIFIVAWITLLATVTSIIEQIHDMRCDRPLAPPQPPWGRGMPSYDWKY